MRAATEQTNRSEQIWHALVSKSGHVAFCGHELEQGAPREDATVVPREVRCGEPACQAAYQGMFETGLAAELENS